MEWNEANLKIQKHLCLHQCIDLLKVLQDGVGTGDVHSQFEDPEELDEEFIFNIHRASCCG